MTVDIKRAHAANTLTTVVVEDKRLLAVLYQLLVKDVQHLEEGGITRDVLHLEGVKWPFSFGPF